MSGYLEVQTWLVLVLTDRDDFDLLTLCWSGFIATRKAFFCQKEWKCTLGPDIKLRSASQGPYNDSISSFQIGYLFKISGW